MLASSFWSALGPGLLGAIIGAAVASWLTYVFAKRLLDDQFDRQQRALVAQVRRDAADETEQAMHRLETGAKDARDPQAWARLHNQWQDDVLAYAWRLHHAELMGRLESVGAAIFTRITYGDQVPLYGVLRACDNARQGLRAFLADEPLPPSVFPTRDELFSLLWSDAGATPDLKRYQQWLAEHAAD